MLATAKETTSADIEEILRAIWVLYVPSAPSQDRPQAEAFLLDAYRSPHADSLAIALLQCATTASTRLCSTEDERRDFVEILYFNALQFFQEILRSGKWKDVPVERRSKVKTVLLQMALDERYSAPLTQKKLASVMASVSLLEWPLQWPELFPTLQNGSSPHHLTVFLSVLGEVAHVCGDPTVACPVAAPVKRRREIIQELQTHNTETILKMLQAASAAAQSPLSGTSANGALATVSGKFNSQSQKETFVILIMETLSSLCEAMPLAVPLLSARVDQLVFYSLMSFPESQQAALNVLLSITNNLAKRQRHAQRNGEFLPEADLQRYCTSIAEIAQQSLFFSRDPAVYSRQTTVGVIVKDLIEKLGDVLLDRLPQSTLETVWKQAVWRLLIHPSLTIATHGVAAATALLSRFSNVPLPSWLNLHQFLGIMYLRSIRQGDPILYPYLKALFPLWPKAPSSVSSNASTLQDLPPYAWPVWSFGQEVATQLALPSEATPRWTDLCDAAIWLEGDACQDDYESDTQDALQSPVDTSQEPYSAQVLNQASATFRQQMSTFKTAFAFPIIALWNHSPQAKADIFHFIQFVWGQLCSSPVLAATASFEPIKVLMSSAPALSKHVSSLPERLKPRISPVYVVLDALFSLIELIANKIRTDALFSGSTGALNSPEVSDGHALEGTCKWETPAGTFFTSLLSFTIPTHEMTHHIEIRRLDFIGASAHLITLAGINVTTVLQLIFEKILLDAPEDTVQEANTMEPLQPVTPLPVLVNGVVENWRDQAYLIRRRALYALISFCQKTDRTLLEPFLEQILARVRTRLSASFLHDTEKGLLIESMVSAACAIENLHFQESFITDLTASLKNGIVSKQFTTIAQQVDIMRNFLFGVEANWSGPADAVEQATTCLAENRRTVARLLGQVDGILKQCTLPRTSEALLAGHYLTVDISTFDRQRAEAEKELDLLIRTDENLAPRVVFAIRHPAVNLVAGLVDTIFTFLETFQRLWVNNNTPEEQAMHILPLLGLGEEEWKALEGDVLEHRTGPKLRNTVEASFPIPGSLLADAVRLTRRHTYHIRTLLYRCLGGMTKIHSAFFGHSMIQKKLRNLLRETTATAPIYHIPTSLEQLWSKVFDERLLVELYTSSTFPVWGFLDTLFPECLTAHFLRLTHELGILHAQRNILSEAQDISPSGNVSVPSPATKANSTTPSLYLLQGYCLTRIAMSILLIIGQLLHLKGSNTSQATSTSQNTMHRTSSKSCVSGKALSSVSGGGPNHASQPFHDSDSDSETPTSAGLRRTSSASKLLATVPIPDSSNFLNFKHELYGRDHILQESLRFCAHLLRFPNAAVITEAYRVLRVYAKHCTKNLSPIQPCTPKLLAATYQGCLSSIFSLPTTDISALSNPSGKETSSHDGNECTPLSHYISGKDPSNSLKASVVTTLYECLRSLYRKPHFRDAIRQAQPPHLGLFPSASLYWAVIGRWYSIQCNSIKKCPNDPNNVVLCPELYDSLLSLARLPCPMGPEDLELLTRELIQPKEQHDSKTLKGILSQLVAANLSVTTSEGKATSQNVFVYTPPEGSLNLLKSDAKADSCYISASFSGNCLFPVISTPCCVSTQNH